MSEEKPYQVKMPNVRLSFPSLFETEWYGGKDTGKYAATFILDKVEHADVIKELQAKIKALLETIKVKSLSADKICLKDGDTTDNAREEDEGKFKIKASSQRRPFVLDRSKSPVTESDEVFYAGCYVNAIVNLWAQNSKDYGKRINCGLEGVMFSEHGEPFGAPRMDVSEFDAFGDADEEAPF